MIMFSGVLKLLMVLNTLILTKQNEVIFSISWKKFYFNFVNDKEIFIQLNILLMYLPHLFNGCIFRAD